MQKLFYLFIVVILLAGCRAKAGKTDQAAENGFSFVFMTDIHLMPEKGAPEGVLQAIDTINKLAPDFILTGGDNIMDALAQSYERSDSLFDMYDQIMKNLNMPVYHSLGNHEIFGLYKSSGIYPSHEEYGKKLYENRLANRYYSFDHKNWHFVVLDGIGFTDDRKYYGYVDSVQLDWLKKDLEQTGKETPIAVSIHIPLLSVGQQIIKGPTEGFSPNLIITNAHEVIDILEQYNVKMVLQGHLHFLEDIWYNGIHYITGGAVSSNWWKGPRFGLEEGFLHINVSGEDFEWEYIDFGWEAVSE